MTGVGLVTGYGLLGATWLVMKSTGELELWARRKALAFLIATIIAMGIVSAWVPFLGRQIEERWFSWPNMLILSPVPLLTAYTAWRLYRSLEDGRHYSPFFLAIGLFLLGFLGLVVSLYPYAIPPHYTIWQAANVPSAQMFALIGYAVVMPLTFLYTAYAYYVFRGKVAEDVQSSGYH
jgi:cytochrome bd ubiquinol oxidase subunit II